MTGIKPSDHGIVVENKESGLRYASLDRNFDPKSERKVRDLKSGESVFSYGIKQPRPSFAPLGEQQDEDDLGDLQEEDEEEDLNTEGNPDTFDGNVEGQQ